MTTMSDASRNAGQDTTKVTPWNPSKSAIRRVLNPLPAPTTCPHCGSSVEIHTNNVIYSKMYGDWPWIYVCMGRSTKICDAYVGMHPFTNIPLGTLATADIRDARKRVKSLFNPLWDGPKATFTRSQAYKWLADKLGIPKEECHFGWFDVDMCQRAELILMEAKK